jgi:hypothetical protein
MKMVVSLEGLLGRAAEACESKRDWQTKSLGFSLRELNQHIESVRANPELVHEFLALYVGPKSPQKPEAHDG